MAYDVIVDFLDNAAAMEFPEELQAFLRDAAPACDTAFIHRLIEDNGKLMEAPEQYLRAHRSSIERQLEYRQSDEYRQSPAFQLQEKIIELMRASGYYEVFIPAMKELSPAYAAYTEELAAVNRIFLTMYPEAAKLNT